MAVHSIVHKAAFKLNFNIYYFHLKKYMHREYILLNGFRKAKMVFTEHWVSCSFNPICQYTLHTHQKLFFIERIMIVNDQNQQFGGSPTSILPYKQCKVLFGFSRLSQHCIFSMYAMG